MAMVNTREYEWADITVVVAGRSVVGLRAIQYGVKQEKEGVYGKGNKPLTIQKGNKEFSGELGWLQSEYQAIKAAAQVQGGDILDLEFNVIVSYGNPSKGDAITTDILIGCQFTEDMTDWKQGDKFTEKTHPFIYLDQKSA